MAAGAAHAADLKEFRVGILGGENEADRLRNYQCLADHLKTEFGFEKVSLFPAADYDGVIQGLLGGTLDFAELGASGYASVYLKDPKAVTPILTTPADRRLDRLLFDRSCAQVLRHHRHQGRPRARSSATPIRIRPRAT